jgi:hypothetical protein
MPTVHTMTELEATDFLTVSREDINENFNILNSLATETQVGLTQLANTTDVDNDASDVVLTPSKLLYKLGKLPTVLPESASSNIGDISNPFGSIYLNGSIVLSGSILTVVSGELMIDGSSISGGSSGITLADVENGYVSLTSNQTISGCTKIIDNTVLKLDNDTVLEFINSSDTITPDKGVISLTSTDQVEIVGNEALNLDGGVLGVKIGSEEFTGKIRSYRSNTNIEKLPISLGSASFVDWDIVSNKTIYLDEGHSGQTIYVGGQTTVVYLPAIYDEVNNRKLNGTKYTFIKTDDSSDLTITANSSGYNIGGIINGADKIGDSDLGEVASMATSGSGFFHSITLEAVITGSLSVNGDTKSFWVVTSKTGTW